ncbi:glycosyltransferase [Latilactobacillus curvatus]|uniref:glycosyltransferase n=1 Tax=Latilactobacillus curvatus TaxID=28038 RepID=UPI000975D00A|nr:glycosyltransferase [Latilactobacillus curvatus]MCT1216009.1 glycosyltransferase [Latilactobacillus curvatus]
MTEDISVIMSVYNEKISEVSESIESILDQSIMPTEFLIVLDNPKNIKLKEYLESMQTNNSIIELIINKTNIGLAASLNKGIKLSKCSLIARMDADDISMKDRFKEELEVMRTQNADIVSTNCVYIDEESKVIGKKKAIPTKSKDIAKILPIGSSIVHPSVLIKKSVFNECGVYRDFYTAEDYDLWLRCLSKNKKIISINKSLLKYRIRAQSMTQSNYFLVFLTANYQRKLYKERTKNRDNQDSFSKESYEHYLRNAGYYSSVKKKSFSKKLDEFNQAVKSLKEKRFRSAAQSLCKSISSIDMVRYVTYFIRYQILVLGIRR